MKKILCAFIVIIILPVLTVPQISNNIRSYRLNNSNSSIPQVDVPGINVNISIENISGGFGITGVVRNSGESDLSDIEVTINITRGSFIRLTTTHYEIPLLPMGESTKIHIKLFGIGLGRLTQLPEIMIVVSFLKKVQKVVRIDTMVLGPFTKIVGTYFDDEAFNGYILFSPEYSTKTFVMDKHGNVVHRWESNFVQGLGIDLLEDGSLLRTAIPYSNPVFVAGGVTGCVERFDWNGTLLWDFNYSNSQHCLHHGIEMLPNGNILMVGWEYKTAGEAIAAGRNPSSLPVGSLWPDHVIEVKPTGSSGGTIVWEWHVWDHLIQDFDPTKENYGVVGQHPELMDINYGIFEGRYRADWNHINSIDYNQKFDQILLSAHNQQEIWIIDHSTTTGEAAGHTGGRSGKGGDLLYRWGNPRTYRAGGIVDQQLFGQHDAQWIPSDCPGSGHILIFNNGQGRPYGQYSSVDEIIPPVDTNGTYFLEPGSAYGPNEPVWSYTDENPFDFYAGYLSGTQRLPNGNTLICDGDHGIFFEVTMKGKMVWEYRNTIPNPINNQVFKILCYAPDYPGLRYLFD